MILKIGSIIKSLRAEKKVTQERYDPIREDARFKAITAELATIAE